MPNVTTDTLIGWVGAVTSLTAYGLNTQQVVSSSSLLYLILNVVACSCLGFYTFRKKAYANTLLNTLWLLASITALLRLL